MKFILTALIVATVSLGPQISLATDKDDAKKHFEAGVTLQKNEDFAGAATEFEESVNLHPTKAALFNLANCYKALQQYADSLAILVSLEQEFGKSLDKAMKREVKKMRKAIEAVVCTLKVRVKKKDASVFVDGRLIGKSLLPLSATLGPGEHEVRVESPGVAPVVQAVKLVSGEERELVFAMDGTDASAVGSTTQQPSVAPTPRKGTIPPSGVGCTYDGHCRRPHRCAVAVGQCTSRTMRRAFQTDGESLRRLRVGGGIIVGVSGITFLSAGIPLAIMFGDTSSDVYNQSLFAAIGLATTGGVVLLAVGLPLLLTGIVGRNRYEKIKLEVGSHKKARSILPWAMAARNGGVLGISAVF
jgi:hypothetical protein